LIASVGLFCQIFFHIRKGVNPQTRETIQTSAKKVPKFRPGRRCILMTNQELGKKLEAIERSLTALHKKVEKLDRKMTKIRK
jgi:methylphosphotriester-DNA--protein-cysteine methyltransferase